MATIKEECFEKMLEIKPLQPLPKPGCGSVRFYLVATAKAALAVFRGRFLPKDNRNSRAQCLAIQIACISG